MIFVCHNNLSNLLIIKIRGVFTQQDFELVFIPQFEQLITEYQTANLLLEFDQDFTGWELAALWRELKFSLEHFQSINKIALIGNDNVIKWSFRLLHPFSTLFINRFKYGQREVAKAWLTV